VSIAVQSPSSALRPRTVALILLAILTVYGVDTHARRRALSPPATQGDQGAYLAYARLLKESNYTLVADRNRMPVFPFLLSLIYRPNMPEDEFLHRAQVANINLSIALLAALFFIFRGFFVPLVALALVATTAFGVFLYRAPNAQTEVLFYFVSFCGFLLLLRMLIAPGWLLAVFAGGTMGLAHLTKASVLPALGIWVVTFAAQMLSRARHSNRNDLLRRLAMFLVVIVTFLAVVSPYIVTSKRIYGAWFYNVNSTFVMWADSSTEGYEFLKAHDKDQWRQLPPEQLPSASKYWREHSVGQIAGRLWEGSLSLLTRNAMPIGYYKFMLAFGVAAAVLFFRQRGTFAPLLSAQVFAVAFCILFFGAYAALYAWYDVISNDTRFVLSIFLPALFAGALFVFRAGEGRLVPLPGRRWPFAQFFSGLLIALAMIDAAYNARFLFR
jgi:hypothetical protein